MLAESGVEGSLKTIVQLIFTALLLMANVACAASFDCTNPSLTKAEYMVCSDPELSRLDEELSEAYSKALKESSDPTALKQQQRDWMTERGKCIYKDCLRYAYQSRIAQFPASETGEIPSTSRYKLIKGKGIKVCEAYARYLATQIYQLRCDRDVPPQIAELQKPSWKELDVKENKLLVLRIENYLEIPRDEKATAPFRPVHREGELTTYSPPMHARLAVAQIDIDNDGNKETVARYRSFMCQEWDIAERAPHWKGPLVVFDSNSKRIDIEKTYPLMQNPWKVYVGNSEAIEKAEKDYFEASRKAWTPDPKEFAKRNTELRKLIPKAKYENSRYSPGISMRKGYDAFEFMGKSFFDQWNEEKGDGYQSLTVYQTESGETDEICRFQYH